MHGKSDWVNTASYERNLHLRRGTLGSERIALPCNDDTVHFGLGQADTIDTLSVRWPSGAVQTFNDLAADRQYTITEPSSVQTPEPANPSEQETLLTEVSESVGLDFKHIETPYDDYARQPLLPSKLSQLGGGLAWGLDC